MLITSATLTPTRTKACRNPLPSEPQIAPSSSDSVTLSGASDRKWRNTEDLLISGTIIAGISLAGAAVGAYAGNATGLLAGVAGAVVGLSAGVSVAAQLPSQDLKTGAILGAIAGGIAGASFGGTTSAVVLGLAGATLPYGASMGLAGLLGY
jgi:hypothetical protein